jgi:hypothetical protein
MLQRAGDGGAVNVDLAAQQRLQARGIAAERDVCGADAGPLLSG